MALSTKMEGSEVFSAPWRRRTRVRRDFHGMIVQGLVGLPLFQIISSHILWKEVLIKSIKEHMWYSWSCCPKLCCCICSALQLVTVKWENKISELCNAKSANPSPTEKQAQCTWSAIVGKVKFSSTVLLNFIMRIIFLKKENIISGKSLLILGKK